MKATMGDMELNAAGGATWLQNVQDSRPENQIHPPPLPNDRVKTGPNMLLLLGFL